MSLFQHRAFGEVTPQEWYPMYVCVIPLSNRHPGFLDKNQSAGLCTKHTGLYKGDGENQKCLSRVSGPRVPNHPPSSEVFYHGYRGTSWLCSRAPAFASTGVYLLRYFEVGCHMRRDYSPFIFERIVGIHGTREQIEAAHEGAARHPTPSRSPLGPCHRFTRVGLRAWTHPNDKEGPTYVAGWGIK